MSTAAGVTAMATTEPRLSANVQQGYDALRADAGPDFEARINDALTRAGDNRQAIADFLDGVRSTGDARRQIAAEFLVANMPTVDLVSMSASDLAENLTYAFSAYDDLPWARQVPFNLFLHYVLPHRVTQEPFEPWRPAVYTELAAALAECRTMVDAAIAVNYWCGARVGFQQTEFRDQNLNMTLRAGYGRCEEMMIVAIAALRAMGLPARPCSAPWWVTTDNNHAWVEVWADGHWYYLGGCEPAPGLDQAWFGGAAQRAGIVVSRMFGDPKMFPTGEVVARAERDGAVINSTAVYALTGEVEIVVVGADGTPVADCPVALSAFNFGAFRSLLTGSTDSAGRVRFAVGLGEYFYSAGNDAHGRDHAVIRTEPAGTVVHWMTLSPGAAPPERVVLRYPTPAEAAAQAARRAKSTRTAVASFRPELPPNPGVDRYEPGKMPALDDALAGLTAEDAEAWRGVLKGALGNWRAIATGLLDQPDDRRATALAFVQQLAHLDRLEVRADTIADHVSGALSHRRPGISDSDFRNYVLNPRIDTEHVSPWRLSLSLFSRGEVDRPTIAETVRALNDFTATRLRPLFRSSLGPTMNPVQVMVSGHAEPRERVIFAVGALRALGIPARKEATRNRVEYLGEDGRWHSFDPGTAPAAADEREVAADRRPTGDSPGADPSAEAAASRSASGPGVVRLSLSSNGQPVDGNFSGFDVSRFAGGQWAGLRSYDSNFDGWTRQVTLPAGEYLVTAGVRNSNGDPAVRTQVIDLQPGAEVTIAWDLEPPSDAGSEVLPIARVVEGLLDVRLPEGVAEGAGPITIGSWAGAEASAVVLFVFSVDNEPSKRMFDLLREAGPGLVRDSGVRLAAVRLPDGAGTRLDEFLSGRGAAFPVVDGDLAFGDALGLKRTADGEARFAGLPSVLVVDSHGQVRLWVEGYHLNLVALLQRALTVVGEGSRAAATASAAGSDTSGSGG